MWKLKSTFYYFFRHNLFFIGFLRQEDRAIQLLLESAQHISIKRALDIGTGRGHCLFFVPQTVDTIYAIDTCIEMIKKAKLGWPHVQFVNADVIYTPLRHCVFDLIFCVGISEYISDIRPVLQNIHNLLNFDGFCIFTMSPNNIFTWLRFLLGHRLFPKSESYIERLLTSLQFKIVKKTKTLLQMQYLIQK